MLKPSVEYFLFIDDSDKNTQTASAMGITTLLYHPEEHNLYQRVTEYLNTFAPEP